MVTKGTTAYVHPSRRDHVPNQPRRKRQKPDNAGPKSFKKAHPVNELKSQIRSLQRLLERNERLPADVRVEKERALQTAQYELAEAQKSQQRSDMIGRYHKVRFFDRQKAVKRLKRAQKERDQYEAEDEWRAELEKRVDAAQVDVNYALYYPLDQHYVSLFPRRKTSDQNEEDKEDVLNEEEAAVEREGDPEMWERVKLSMANGTLDALRNGKLTERRSPSPVRSKRRKTNQDVGLEPEGPTRQTLSNAKTGEQKDVNEESDGDGDGFFEP